LSLFERLSRKKYHSEQTLSDGTPLIWPGDANGIPVAGKVIPNLKGDQYDNLKYQLNFHCRWFDMMSHADTETMGGLESYARINDKIMNGLYIERRRRELEKDGNLYVLLEWGELYGEAPDER
jgi:hypothetical protein